MNDSAYRIVNVHEMTLIGIKLNEPFPGFDQKAEYLASGWKSLKVVLDGKLITETPTRYFVYHGSEVNLSLCVQMKELNAIPDGLVKITVPSREFAVFTYKGLLNDQEKIFMDICNEDFPMDLDAIRFEQYDERFLPSTSQECEFELYFPMIRE